jgi:serine/threonine protein kinase
MDASGHRYQRLEKLGEGSYGIVYKAQDTLTGQIVALKCMKLEEETDGIRPTTLREISILRSMSHPNILGLKDVLVVPTSITLVTEYLDYDLRIALKRIQGPLAPDLACSYAYQILAGVLSLHLHRVIHRDLKPENILLGRDGSLKIADFGLSRYFTLPLRQYTPDVVTMWYRAPELLVGLVPYELSIDLWSAACIVAEMTTGKPIFAGDSPIDQLHKILMVLGTPAPDDFPHFAAVVREFGALPEYPRRDLREVLKTNNRLLVDLIGKLLRFDPAQRLSAQEAVAHPYFNDVSPKLRARCWPMENKLSED